MTSPVSGRTAHIAWTRTGTPIEVLFLHGFSDSGACWDPVVRAVSPRWEVLTLDARGHGASGLPDGPAGASEHAADAAMVLDDQATVDGGVIVVGHSMGAGTAIALAELRPDLVRALVLEDPVLRLPSEEPPERPPAGLPEGLRALRAMSLEQRIKQGRAENPTWADDELEPWALAKAELAEDFTLHRPSVRPAPDLAAATNCPVLLVRGDPDRGSIVTPGAASDAVRRADGRIESVHITGVGHSIRREARDRFLVELGAFLGRHAA
ncbi:alpha/beta hydrolase [Actinomycetospora sp.]|uniref:alpha/beta fold hydrolase n=1 Tax=Actinomycetospora sp. TaxID=1872135 RepID=UPI002F42B756